jgi:aromatic ring hydroxylase
MALSAREREIVADLIGSVRTLAAHVTTLHLQLGAIRRLLARRGVVTDEEVQAALAELRAVTATEEALDTALDVDAVFAELLQRLDRAT